MENKYKVLLVDNNPTLVAALGIYLMENDFEVGLPAYNYASVVSILGQTIPDIVLIEWYMNGNFTEANIIAEFIDLHYHLLIIFIIQNAQAQLQNIPAPNHRHLFIPHPSGNIHYYAHILVAIDNMLNTDKDLQHRSKMVELRVATVPLLKNGEPKLLKKSEVHYYEKEMNLYEIPLVRSNNLASRNTCLLWQQNNYENCFQEYISLQKIAQRQKEARLIRISKYEMVMLDKIQSYQKHHTIIVDNRTVEIGRSFRKSIDELLQSIHRLN